MPNDAALQPAATVRLNRSDFLSRLESVEAGLSPSEATDQSSYFAFTGGYVRTFNDEVAGRNKSLLPKAFKGAVLAKKLLELLRKLTEEDVTIDLTGKEFKVKGRNREFGIRMQSEIHMPLEKVDPPGDWQPLHEDFSEAVTIVQECAGKDQSKFALTCIHITPTHVEACDRYQLTRYTFPTGFEGDILLMKESVKPVLALDMTEFTVTKAWVHFRNPTGVVISLRRYTEQYHDMAKWFDMPDAEPAALPKGLAEAAEKAGLLSMETDNKLVTVDLKPNLLRIRGEGDSGWYTEVKKVTYHGPPITFHIDPRLLAEITKRHHECLVTATRLKVDGGKWQYVTGFRKKEGAAKKQAAAEGDL